MKNSLRIPLLATTLAVAVASAGLAQAGAVPAEPSAATPTSPPTGAATDPTEESGSVADPAPVAATAPGPRVAEVLVERDGALRPEARLTLEDHIVPRISGLASWLGENESTCWDIRLVFDGERVGRLGPERCDLEQGLVWFNLERVDRPAEPAWTNLLERRDGLEAPVEISVALADKGAPLPSAVSGDNAPTLLLAHQGRLWGVGILFLATLVLFSYLSVRSDMLRDKGPRPAAPARRPYSLSRFQMGWWFVLALFAFLLISLLTGDAVAIPGTVLGLMGIAAGTHVGSEMIDSSRSGSAGNGGSASGGKAAGAGTPAPAGRPAQSRGFITDIISDGQGVALHRFQNFIFTLALGGFFVVKVISQLKMPEFDPSLLGLMGISAGTYLGVKVPESDKGDGG